MRGAVRVVWPGRVARAATTGKYGSREGEGEGRRSRRGGSPQSCREGQWAQGGLGWSGEGVDEADDGNGDEAVQRVGLRGGRRGVHRATGGDEEVLRGRSMGQKDLVPATMELQVQEVMAWSPSCEAGDGRRSGMD